MIGEFKHTQTKAAAGRVDHIRMVFFENSYSLVSRYESEKRLSEDSRRQHNLEVFREKQAE